MSAKKTTTKKPASTKTPAAKDWLIQTLPGLEEGDEEDHAHIHQEDIRDAIDELRVHRGNLTIDGNFYSSNGALLVIGDLRVSGVAGADETGTIVVTGGLYARNLDCEGNIEVHGDAHIVETVFGFYQAGITSVEGTLRAALFLSGNHDFLIANERVETRLAFDNFQSLRIGTAEDARRVLNDEALACVAKLMGIGTAGAGDGYGRVLRKEGFLRAPHAP